MKYEVGQLVKIHVACKNPELIGHTKKIRHIVSTVDMIYLEGVDDGWLLSKYSPMILEIVPFPKLAEIKFKLPRA